MGGSGRLRGPAPRADANRPSTLLRNARLYAGGGAARTRANRTPPRLARRDPPAMALVTDRSPGHWEPPRPPSPAFTVLPHSSLPLPPLSPLSSRLILRPLPPPRLLSALGRTSATAAGPPRRPRLRREQSHPPPPPPPAAVAVAVGPCGSSSALPPPPL